MMLVKRRIYYILLLAAGIYFIMLYNFQGLRFLFGCAVFIPFLCFLFLVFGAFRCQIHVEAEQTTVTRGEPVRLKIKVENRGFFPFSRVLVSMNWQECGEKEIRVKKRLRGIRRNRQEEIPVEMPVRHCGRARFVITKVRLYDYLGIFALPVRGRKSVEICVAPVLIPVPMEEIGAAASAYQEKDGDMLLRSFQPGDSLHRVYWKLSMKADELQVRDYEPGGSVLFFLDFPPKIKNQAQEWDRYLDTACSLICALMERNQASQIPLKAVWMQDGSFLEYEIQDMEALQAWLYAMLMQGGTGLPFAEEEVPLLRKGFCLEGDCRLYFGEQCLYENEGGTSDGSAAIR